MLASRRAVGPPADPQRERGPGCGRAVAAYGAERVAAGAPRPADSSTGACLRSQQHKTMHILVRAGEAARCVWLWAAGDRSSNPCQRGGACELSSSQSLGK
jgi:hypothetical protein